jgi:hypothetical protein
MTSSDLEKYLEISEKAKQRANQEINQRHQQYMNSLAETEKNEPSIFERILSRFGNNAKTTISGAVSMIVPVVMGLLGLPNEHIILANAALATVTAYIAKSDKTTAFNLAGSVAAMALSTFVVPIPTWLIAIFTGFTGFMAKDQVPVETVKPVQPLQPAP